MKRSPLTRKAPLRRIGKRGKARMKAMAAIPCRYRCDRCGKPGRTDKHHRLARSLGGKDVPENIAYLCRRCHDGVHAAAVPDWRNWLLAAHWTEGASRER